MNTPCSSNAILNHACQTRAGLDCKMEMTQAVYKTAICKCEVGQKDHMHKSNVRQGTYLCRGGRHGVRHWGEGETPFVGALHQQLAGHLLKVTLRPGLRDCVQMTGQAAAPLQCHSPSHEGNAGFLHARAAPEHLENRAKGLRD